MVLHFDYVGNITLQAILGLLGCRLKGGVKLSAWSCLHWYIYFLVTFQVSPLYQSQLLMAQVMRPG